VVLLLSLLACAPNTAVWAVAQGSVVPTSNGVEGVQAWSFYAKDWGRASGDGAFVCTRAQSFTGTVVAADSGCEGCIVAYELTYAEMGTDCPDDLATDPAYALPVEMGIGQVSDELVDLDPHPGESAGWYANLGGPKMEPYGFTWNDALDWGGDEPPPGWNVGQAYTLTSAIAWDLTQ